RIDRPGVAQIQVEEENEMAALKRIAESRGMNQTDLVKEWVSEKLRVSCGQGSPMCHLVLTSLLITLRIHSRKGQVFEPPLSHQARAGKKTIVKIRNVGKKGSLRL
ncbi:MAG: hypothetical protein JXL84_24775, partial [Deltaproteobacteria bacterium]|nr:hypothetical protein [Deltaproteobacteria bacterium]